MALARQPIRDAIHRVMTTDSTAVPKQEICGILALNKPKGITSRDAVNMIQRWATGLRLGHAGTLDPLATGVLVVCVGRATRLISLIQELPKVYRATFLLGRSSPTDDVDGEITIHEGAVPPTLQQIETVLPEFTGRILQRPPVYSAVKIRGRRGYEWARQGTPQLPQPRPVDVYELKVLRYEYPELEMEIRCGSGTYVRSLGRDLAENLGTRAVMSELTRLAVGRFTLEESVDPRTLETGIKVQIVAAQHLPQLRLDEASLRGLLHGQWPRCQEELVPGQKAAVVDQFNNLLAIVEVQKGSRLKPLVNLATPAH